MALLSENAFSLFTYTPRFRLVYAFFFVVHECSIFARVRYVFIYVAYTL
jgi:hypothetical protein